MIYLDSNVLVSLLVGDSNVTSATEWCAGQVAPLAVSAWVVAEVYAHIGLRCRKGEETARNATRIIDRFDEMVERHLTLCGSSDRAIHQMNTWLRDPACSLQPGDVLHLAIALENEVAAIATFDERFARNIAKLNTAGLKVIALPNAGASHEIQQKRADYSVTVRDITNAVKWARKRKIAEKERAPRLRVRVG